MKVQLVGEDQVHQALGQHLSEAVLGEGVEWLRVEGKGYYKSTHRKEDVARLPRKVKIHGQLEIDKDLRGPLRELRELQLLFLHLFEKPDLLLILKDDGKDQLFSRAFEHLEESRLPVVGGFPYQDAEGWLVAGCTQQNRLKAVKDVLGFDPSQKPERLTESPNDLLTDAKRVLRFLELERVDLKGSKADKEEQLRQVESAPPSLNTELEEVCTSYLSDLKRLKQNGEGCGLKAFLVALEKYRKS